MLLFFNLIYIVESFLKIKKYISSLFHPLFITTILFTDFLLDAVLLNDINEYYYFTHCFHAIFKTEIFAFLFKNSQIIPDL